MAGLLYYIIAIVLGGMVFLLSTWLNKKSDKAYSVVLKVLSLVLSTVFLCRYMMGPEAIQGMHGLSNTPL